jgi:hypothetical protein
MGGKVKRWEVKKIKERMITTGEDRTLATENVKPQYVVLVSNISIAEGRAGTAWVPPKPLNVYQG